jgi:Protein of unknown function (DUF1329)
MKTEWTRRQVIKAGVALAGSGLLQPLLPLVAAGKDISKAFPEEVLSIEKYTKGKVKPGMIINKDNVELIKDISPEGLVAIIQHGQEIKIGETTLDPRAVNPDFWVEATLRNQGKATLDAKGQLWTKDGKLWIGGSPFPEARTGLQALWNYVINHRRYDDLMAASKVVNVGSDGSILQTQYARYGEIQTVGRLVVAPKPNVSQYKNELHRTLLGLTSPFDLYGLAVATVDYYNASQMPDTFVYVPALHRVRRVSSSDRFSPAAPFATYFVSDLDLQNDPLLTWDWTLVGRKPLLGPSPVNRGAFISSTKEDFTWPDYGQKYPRTTWELRPDMFLVDGVPHIYGAPYGKKRMYVDAVYYRAQMAQAWDKAGKLWKFFTFITGSTGIKDNAGGIAKDLTGILFADVQRDAASNVWFYPKLGELVFRVNVGATIDDWMTEAALLRRARR